jgi:FemAB-related protein (PEP-CTERM system-associated)
MTRVQRLAVGDAPARERWERFVADCPQATFFHRAGWQAVIEQVFGHRTHFLYTERDGALTGVLPLAQVKSWLFGHALIGLPFASYGGIATQDEGARTALENEARRLAEELGVDYLELRNLEPQQAGWPTQDLYVAFKMPIPAVLDEKMLCIPQKRRNMVRKALKLGLHAVPDDSVENFFPVFAANARDHGTPTLPRKYFDALKATFGTDCSIMSIYDAADRCISAILCFFHKGEVLAYYAGELPAARGTAANDLKYWEVMKWAAARGCTRFDIGRSKRGTGSFDFKKLWGFEPVPLHYQYALTRRAAIPQNNPTNPKYRLLIRTWQRLPLPVANRIGPMIVRSLG